MPLETKLEPKNYLKGRLPNYDKTPFINIQGQSANAIEGWKNIVAEINSRIKLLEKSNSIIAVEYYPGVHEDEILEQLISALAADNVFNTQSGFKSQTEILEMTQADVTDDAIFGFMTQLTLQDFFDDEKLAETSAQISSGAGITLVFGYGASLLASNADILMYADMPRWELQLRYRRNEINNLGIINKDEKATLQYKRGYFVDWRVADTHKKVILPKCDYLLDTTTVMEPKMLRGETYRTALKTAVSQPFRVVPFFDPGPWGGQWMKQVCELDPDSPNFAWCFDCVPEENSLLLKFDDIIFETPSINLVFSHPQALLGEAVQSRFGDEFPIRFDFLDTMEGGNLSLQVHPTKAYAKEKFGINYTQDESYYILDAGDDACVYLGFKDDIDPEQMLAELRDAQSGKGNFDAEKHVMKWPVKKHDHVLIPEGTIHCSGSESMVLEISATPYIFTFKLWDWNRMGLDGKPRPINIEHGKNVLDWSRTSEWTSDNLIDAVEPLAEGNGWREERTGLSESQFIETRRHWFSEKVAHETGGGVNVLNLVEGEEALVESPDNAFAPFPVHFAETFIIPAQIGSYTIKSHGKSAGKTIATIKAYVRT